MGFCFHKDNSSLYAFECIDDFVNIIGDGINRLIGLVDFYNTYEIISC